MTPRNALGWRLPLSLLLAAASACALDGSELGDPDLTLWDPADSPGERRVLATGWDTLAARPGDDRDTLLSYPHRIASHPGGVYVYDDGARRVVSFDPALRLRAVAGRRGGGPGEFEAVRDLTVTPSGDAAVLDPGNGRISIISPEGSLRSMIPVRDVAGPEQLVFDGDDAMVVYASNDRERPLVLLDSTGRVIERRELPWDGFSRLAPLSVNGRLSKPTGGSTSWAFLFGYGNGWFAFEEDRAPVTGRYVEHTSFPVPFRTDDGIQLPPAPTSAMAAATSDSLLYVLFAGSGPGAQRNIDVHRLRDGRYLGSYELPSRAVSFSPHGDGFYVLFHEPSPSLYLLRPRIPPAQPDGALAGGREGGV